MPQIAYDTDLLRLAAPLATAAGDTAERSARAVTRTAATAGIFGDVAVAAPFAAAVTAAQQTHGALLRSFARAQTTTAQHLGSTADLGDQLTTTTTAASRSVGDRR